MIGEGFLEEVTLDLNLQGGQTVQHSQCSGCTWQREQHMQMLKGCEKILRDQEITDGAVQPRLRNWAWFYHSGCDHSGPQFPCLHNDDSGFKDAGIKGRIYPDLRNLF